LAELRSEPCGIQNYQRSFCIPDLVRLNHPEGVRQLERHDLAELIRVEMLLTGRQSSRHERVNYLVREARRRQEAEHRLDTLCAAAGLFTQFPLSAMPGTFVLLQLP